MQRQSLHIAWAVLAAGYTGCMYFLSLVAGIPLGITVILILAALIFFYRAMHRHSTTLSTPTAPRALIVCVCILPLLTLAAYRQIPAEAQWDGYGIWNLHARYLAQPAHWRQLFRNVKMAHPDYPAFLPSNVALLWRLTGRETELVPFGIAAVTTLLIPAWLFVATSSKHIFIAAAAALLFYFNDEYWQQGLSQYADTLLALLLLGACICLQQYRDTGHKLFVFLAAALMGGAAWTKNEGILLAGIFALGYAPVWLKRENIVATVSGAAPFLMAILVYKSYAPANDMVAGRQSSVMFKLANMVRYHTIADYFLHKKEFSYRLLKIAVPAYLVYCGISRKWPSKTFVILLACFAAYCMIYVFTPYDLNWHLNTSASRLIQQLMPAMVYVLATDLSATFAKRSQQ